MKEKKFYKGIYGEDDTLLVRNLINVTNMSHHVQRFQNLIKPHAHDNLLQIFFVEKGSIKLLFEDQVIKVKAPSFFTIPKNVVHGLKTAADTQGYVISISDLALEKMLALDADIFFEIDVINVVKIDMDNNLVENLYTTIKKCAYEFEQRLPARELALEYLTGMLLIRLFRIPKESKLALRPTDNSYKIYFRQFKNLIKETYDYKKTVESYCQELGISNNHLHRICKTITGNSPKKVLTDFFIAESKEHLKNHKYTIADVAYKLGFEDPSYFARLFKSTTNASPTQYRKIIGV